MKNCCHNHDNEDFDENPASIKELRIVHMHLFIIIEHVYEWQKIKRIGRKNNFQTLTTISFGRGKLSTIVWMVYQKEMRGTK